MTNDKTPVSINEAAAYYLSKGYRMITQTESSIQMVKPKKFSWFWGIVLFLLGIFPFIIYLIIYLSKDEEAVNLLFSQEKLTITNHKGNHKTFSNHPSRGQLRRAAKSRLEVFINRFGVFVFTVLILLIILILLVT